MKPRLTGLALVAALLALLPAGNALAATGRTPLDPDFGVKGIAFAAGGVPGKYPWTDASVDAARSTDGTTFVLRRTDELDGRIVAFTAGGALDREFGTAGVEPVPAQLEGATFEAQSIAADAAGRVLIAGKVGTGSAVGVVRLLPSGLPDPSFGGLGHVVRPLTPTSDASPPLGFGATVSVDPAGRVLVIGATYDKDCPRAIDLIRLTEDGEADKAFGADGVVHLESSSWAGESAPQWVGGEGAFELAIETASPPSCTAPGVKAPTFLTRFDAAGDPDSSFGSAGRLEIGEKLIEAVAVDRLGRTVVLYYGSVLRRVGATGSFEASYGRNGSVKLRDLPEARALALTAGGAAVVAGTHYLAGIKTIYDESAALVRVDANGRVVRGFGDRGMAQAHPGRHGEAHGEAVLLDGEGHALVAGLMTSPRNPTIPRGVGLFAFALGH